MSVLAVVGIVSTIVAAAQQADAQNQAAKQTRYDSEFEAEQLRLEAEQERLNREQAAKVEARQSEELKRRRRAQFIAQGGGVGVSQLAELSRQASLDELDIQNVGLASQQRRKALRRAGTNALLSGRARAGAYRAPNCMPHRCIRLPLALAQGAVTRPP